VLEGASGSMVEDSNISIAVELGGASGEDEEPGGTTMVLEGTEGT